MSYVVIKIVKGRYYRYLQTSWREGKRVRTKSICLGPVDGGAKKFAKGLRIKVADNRQRREETDRAMAAAERAAAEVDEYQRKMYGETASERRDRERQEHLARLHELYGLRIGANPTPTGKTTGKAITETDAANQTVANPDTKSSRIA